MSEVDALIGEENDLLLSNIDGMYEYAKEETGSHTLPELLKLAREEKEKSKRTQNIIHHVKTLDTLEEKIEKLRYNFRSKNTGTHIDDKRLLSWDKAEEKINNERLKLSENRETSHISRMVELLKYKEQAKEGFIETSSRTEKKKEIVKLMRESQKGIFLEGSSGTGKTQLLRHIVKSLEGYEPEIFASTDQSRESDIVGKIGLKAENGASVSEFNEGILLRSITEGKIVIFDEFNNMDKSIRLLLKRYFALKPGDTFTVPQDGNTIYTVKEGFRIFATGNLPGPHHPDRNPLGDEETREFEMPHLDQMPANEIYDTLLVASMREDRSVPYSKGEAEIMLANLARAINEAHIAYTEGKSDFFASGGALKGKNQSLKKAVLDPAQYLSWVEGYKNQTRQSLPEYLRDKIAFFAGNGDFPENDRNLLFKIFQKFGFMNGVADLSRFSITEEEAEALVWQPKLIYEKPLVRNLPVEEIAKIDPFNIRQIKEDKLVEDFIAQMQTEEQREILKKNAEQGQILVGEKKEKFITTIDTFWRDTYTTDWSLNGQDLSKTKFVPDLLKPRDIKWQDIVKASDDAKEFGKYITNPETALLDYEKLNAPEIYNPNEDKDLDKWLKKNKLNKTRESVMQYVAEKFSDTHYLPGIEYQKYLFQNQKKKGVIPKELKDGNWYFFPGAAFRNSDGDWDVPYGYWNSSVEVWQRFGRWAWDDWDDDERVLLLGKK